MSFDIVCVVYHVNVAVVCVVICIDMFAIRFIITHVPVRVCICGDYPAVSCVVVVTIHFIRHHYLRCYYS